VSKKLAEDDSRTFTSLMNEDYHGLFKRRYEIIVVVVYPKSQSSQVAPYLLVVTARPTQRDLAGFAGFNVSTCTSSAMFDRATRSCH
jgi:hypothetical protein